MNISVRDGAQHRNLDFSDFAQEFLRRNRDYRRQHAALGELVNHDPLAPECREMARTWGLCFPDLSGSNRMEPSRDLAARSKPCGHRTGTRTAGHSRNDLRNSPARASDRVGQVGQG